MFQFLIQLLFVTQLLSSVKPQSASRCIIQGVCKSATYGFIPCYSQAGYAPIQFESGTKSTQLLRDQCPEMFTEGAQSPQACCDQNQLVKISQLFALLRSIMPGCAQCLDNMRRKFCHVSCGLDQQKFITVKKSSPVGDKRMIKAMDYFLDESFARGAFDACKDMMALGSVKLHQFICNLYRKEIRSGQAECDYKLMFKFFGSDRDNRGYAPFQINFKFVNASSTDADGKSMEAAKLQLAKCSEASGNYKPCPCQLCSESCPKRG